MTTFGTLSSTTTRSSLSIVARAISPLLVIIAAAVIIVTIAYFALSFGRAEDEDLLEVVKEDREMVDSVFIGVGIAGGSLLMLGVRLLKASSESPVTEPASEAIDYSAKKALTLKALRNRPHNGTILCRHDIKGMMEFCYTINKNKSLKTALGSDLKLVECCKLDDTLVVNAVAKKFKWSPKATVDQCSSENPPICRSQILIMKIARISFYNKVMEAKSTRHYERVSGPGKHVVTLRDQAGNSYHFQTDGDTTTHDHLGLGKAIFAQPTTKLMYIGENGDLRESQALFTEDDLAALLNAFKWYNKLNAFAKKDSTTQQDFAE